MNGSNEINHPVLKVFSVWLTTALATTWQIFVGIPWDTLAQFAAFLYSCLLLYEWLVKKLTRKIQKDFEESTQRGPI